MFTRKLLNKSSGLVIILLVCVIALSSCRKRKASCAAYNKVEVEQVK